MSKEKVEITHDETPELRWPEGQPRTRIQDRTGKGLNHSTHYAHDNGRGVTGMIYRASWNSEADFYGRKFEGERRWRPSIHMPRWASRITLEIVSVKVERVQDISEADAIAEGIQVLPLQSESDPSAWYQSAPGVHQERTAKASFCALWDSINLDCGYGWEKNPWVWAIEFKRLTEVTDAH